METFECKVHFKSHIYSHQVRNQSRDKSHRLLPHLCCDEDGLCSHRVVGGVVGVLHDLHGPQHGLGHHGADTGCGILGQVERLGAGVHDWRGT